MNTAEKLEQLKGASLKDITGETPNLSPRHLVDLMDHMVNRRTVELGYGGDSEKNELTHRLIEAFVFRAAEHAAYNDDFLRTAHVRIFGEVTSQQKPVTNESFFIRMLDIALSGMASIGTIRSLNRS